VEIFPVQVAAVVVREETVEVLPAVGTGDGVHQLLPTSECWERNSGGDPLRKARRSGHWLRSETAYRDDELVRKLGFVPFASDEPVIWLVPVIEQSMASRDEEHQVAVAVDDLTPSIMSRSEMRIDDAIVLQSSAHETGNTRECGHQPVESAPQACELQRQEMRVVFAREARSEVAGHRDPTLLS